jgi:hypothetical protein
VKERLVINTCKTRLKITAPKSHLFDQKFSYLQKGFLKLRQGNIKKMEQKERERKAIVLPKSIFLFRIAKYQNNIRAKNPARDEIRKIKKI